jgi:hypothetical protein
VPSTAETLPPPQTFLVADANGDGHVTLADARLWIEHLFFLPGDWAVWALIRYARPLAAEFGIGAPVYGGLLAGTISAAFWFLAGIMVGVAYDYVVSFDNRATRGMHRLRAHTLRALRVAVVWLRAQFKPAEPARDEPVNVELDVDLSAIAFRVLSELAVLKPGYASSAVDVARELSLRAEDVRDLLDTLQRGGLVVRTLGGGEGESGYTLSRRGRERLAQRLGLS